MFDVQSVNYSNLVKFHMRCQLFLGKGVIYETAYSIFV